MSENQLTPEELARTATLPFPNPIIHIDIGGRVTFMNPAAQFLFPDLKARGLEHPFLKGWKPIAKKTSPEAKEHVREVSLSDKHYEQRFYYLEASQKILLYATDITEHRRHAQELLKTLEALRQAKDEWERTFDAVPDMISIIDSQHKIVRVNRAMAQRSGLTPEQCVGRHCHELVHGTDRPPQACPHLLTSHDHKEHTAASHEEHLQGDFLISTTPIFDAHKHMTGVVHVIRDVTALKTVEEQLRKVSKLKSDMVAFISHEYGNALASMTLATTLLRDSGPSVSAEQKEFSLSVLEKTIGNLKVATANFLNVNRLETGSLILDIRPTPIQAALFDEIHILQPLAKAKGMELRLQTDLPKPPPSVNADPSALTLILSNLISNAIKYTPSGGRVTLRVQAQGQPPAEVLFTVEDTGIGIASEEIHKVLAGDYRTPEGRKTAKGFGVGLSLVGALLEKHSSHLEVESTPGRGSRFSFRLPIA